MSSTAPTPDLHAGFSAPGATPTPWEDVVGMLVAAELFWISTVRSDGRPHAHRLPDPACLRERGSASVLAYPRLPRSEMVHHR